jgi:DMSO/TMAO reductase YedYZ molybdopterin-dependent catalytic subunit/thiosulfate reductase cytochrome b subunit
VPARFPLWVVVTHFLNVFFLLLMARSGLEVLSAFPKLYWRSDCRPGHEWLRLSAKGAGADSRRLSSTQQEEVSWSPVVALPGRKNLGLGRHWHFLGAPFWILTGAVYLTLVFSTGYWRYLVPTSWEIVPDSIRAVGTYLHFQLPAPLPGQPYEAAQKLVYFLLIFVLAPFQIATGAAMSPAILARWPWYGRLFGGKQGARSLHFLGLVAFAAFTVLHTALVVIHGLPKELAAIVLGDEQGNRALAVVVGFGGIVLLVLFHVGITMFSLRYRRRTQRLLGLLVEPLERLVSRRPRSRQAHPHRAVSAYFRVNGYPPPGPAYESAVADGFADFRLHVGGLVENPVSLTLAELRGLGYRRQTTEHNCIQGWTGIAEWGGVPLRRVLDLVRPTPEARYAVFYAMDDKGLTEGEGRYGFFYETLPLALLADDAQCLLAMDMNGARLPVEHGAPLRLRAETQLGYKMVKWITSVEFVADVASVGLGQGGWREDHQYYASRAGI